MSILPISHSKSLCSPFVDYLNITVPDVHEARVLEGIFPLLDVVGCTNVIEGLYSLPNKAGTFKYVTKRGFTFLSVSGGLLARLRSMGLYNDYLMVFAEIDYRISMMHVTCDFGVDAPEYINAIYEIAHEGNLHLTRKAIKSEHVGFFKGKNREGYDTGTLYLGDRANADVWAKIYDKRQERLAKGFDDTNPTLRLELAVQSDVKATLRDASNPETIFWHFASKSLTTKPEHVPEWVAHGEGFTIEKRPDNFTAWERISTILEFSNDFSRVLDLAIAEYGDDAQSVLQKIIAKRIRLKTNTSLS